MLSPAEFIVDNDTQEFRRADNRNAPHVVFALVKLNKVITFLGIANYRCQAITIILIKLIVSR